MDKNKIIQDYKNGMTISEIASKLHVATSTISGFIKPLNLPTNKIIKKIINYPGFKEFFINTYNSSSSSKDICNILLKHDFFKRITKRSIYNRMIEIRNYFDLDIKKTRKYISK